MKNRDFDSMMRKYEVFHSLKVVPGAYVVIRVDGRGFSKLTEQMGLDRPFDGDFHKAMMNVTETLVEHFGAVYGYTESDEISILLDKNSDFFDREVEKLVSTSAAIATAAFARELAGGFHSLATFDSRVVVLPQVEDVTDYFWWRMCDATRCSLNGSAYWLLRNTLGKSKSQATKILHGQTVEFKHNLLHENGINWNNLDAWKKRGAGVYREQYEKVGYNPIEKKHVKVKRSRLVRDEEIPYSRDLYESFLKILIGA